jgi:hypothetical protein
MGACPAVAANLAAPWLAACALIDFAQPVATALPTGFKPLKLLY